VKELPQKKLEKKLKKRWLKYIKDVLSSQGFSTQACYDDYRKLRFLETLFAPL